MREKSKHCNFVDFYAIKFLSRNRLVVCESHNRDVFNPEFIKKNYN